MKKLLAVAEIARELDVPESTVHYWKNRFAQYLPSVGQNRQKRFKPEAVEIFRVIADMLRSGHTSRDVMDTLAGQFAVNAAPAGASEIDSTPAPYQAPAPVNQEHSLQMAQSIGLEIARSIADGLKIAAEGGGGSTEQTERDMLQVRDELNHTCALVSGQYDELLDLKKENDTLRDKLEIMEAELVRLRKDRREMEKYLLDKMKRMTS